MREQDAEKIKHVVSGTFRTIFDDFGAKNTPDEIEELIKQILDDVASTARANVLHVEIEKENEKAPKGKKLEDIIYGHIGPNANIIKNTTNTNKWAFFDVVEAVIARR